MRKREQFEIRKWCMSLGISRQANTCGEWSTLSSKTNRYNKNDEHGLLNQHAPHSAPSGKEPSVTHFPHPSIANALHDQAQIKRPSPAFPNSRVLNILQRGLRVLDHPLHDFRLVTRTILDFIQETVLLEGLVVHRYPGDLCGADAEEEEVYCGQAVSPKEPWLASGFMCVCVVWERGVSREAYKRFCGLMTKHQRVQMAPVLMRARF